MVVQDLKIKVDEKFWVFRYQQENISRRKQKKITPYKYYDKTVEPSTPGSRGS